MLLEGENVTWLCVLPGICWKTRPCKTERLLMGRKESNQTNKRLPIKWLEKSCKENDILFHEKDGRFYPQIIRKVFFSLDKYQLKNIG